MLDATVGGDIDARHDRTVLLKSFVTSHHVALHVLHRRDDHHLRRCAGVLMRFDMSQVTFRRLLDLREDRAAPFRSTSRRREDALRSCIGRSATGSRRRSSGGLAPARAGYMRGREWWRRAADRRTSCSTSCAGSRRRWRRPNLPGARGSSPSGDSLATRSASGSVARGASRGRCGRRCRHELVLAPDQLAQGGDQRHQHDAD